MSLTDLRIFTSCVSKAQRLDVLKKKDMEHTFKKKQRTNKRNDKTKQNERHAKSEVISDNHF